jgi:outer membrane protein
MKNDFSKILLATLLFGTVASASYTTPTDAYKAAIENSTKITASKYQFESREEGLNEVYAQLYPQLEGSVSYSRTDYKRNEMLNSRDSYVKEESTDLNISLDQVIYNPVLFSQIDLEKTRVKLYSFDYEISKQKLASESLDIYMSVLNSKNRISLLKANLEYVSQNMKMIEEKYNMSLVTKMDFLKVKVEYQKSNIDLVQEEKNYDVMLKKLKDVTKLDTIEIPDINLNAISENYINNILEVIDNNTSIDRNINILQSRTAVEMASYDIQTAKAEHLPNLGFNATYTEYITDDETSDYENYGRAMVKLRIPIFEGGAISSKVKSKKLLKKSIQEELKTVEDDTTTKLNENVNKLKSEIETLKMFKEAVISGQTYLDSIQLAYEKGLKSIVDLYDAKNKLFEIKYDYIKSIHEMTNLYVQFLITTNNLDNLDLIDNIVLKDAL